MSKPYVFHFGEVENASGRLNFWDSDQLPMGVSRVFWITNVPEAEVRGHHAHRIDHQLIVCPQGQVVVNLETIEGEKFSFILDQPSKGLFLPPMVWSTFTFDANSILLVLAENKFNEQDYLRNKDDFEKLKNEHSQKL